AVAHVAVPDEPSQPDHLGVCAQTIFLIVEEGFDGCDVDDAHALRLILDQACKRGEDRRFGLSPRGRRDDHGVLAVENRLSRKLLHRPRRGPPEPRDDGFLQTWGKAGERGQALRTPRRPESSLCRRPVPARTHTASCRPRLAPRPRSWAAPGAG